jgi:alkanesulfonate monooxygenase SsuD/methylene tetrahydromethanopterin reductase-like flavin-dependent oxidoreductase (luciferase family)
VASAIASRTRRLRIGTAVQVLPLNHPLRIAEEVATVDHISEGRFEFGIGRSGVVRTYDIYGVPYAESQARFREALELIRRGWAGQPFSYEGEFYRVQNAIITPRPYQVPHADPDGDDERRDVSGRRAHGPADLRRPAHDRDPRSAGAARTVPAGVARSRASRATERLPAHPRLRLDHREGRRRGAARA